MTSGKQILYSLIVLIAALILFETTETDIWLQNFLFDTQTHNWLLNTPNQAVRFIFYDGIKILLVLLALAIFICLLFFSEKTLVAQYRKGLLIVFLSLLIVPSVTGALKASTNVACPRDITAYGGTVPYIKVFEHYPETLRPKEKQKCFPAGHASGGFALLSLYFLFHSKINRRRGLMFGMTLGWFMGGYKMLLGHHFLSHTIITMILAWLLINLIVMSSTFWRNKNRLFFLLQTDSD